MIDKNKAQDNLVNNVSRVKRTIIVSLVVIIAIAGALIIPNIYTSAQVTTSAQTINSIKEITPTTTIIKEKIDQVNGIPLTIVGKTTTSHLEAGQSYSTNEGLAEMTLSRGEFPDGQETFVATITNIGQEKFYIKKFGLGGETDKQISALGTLAIDSDYNPSVSRYTPTSKDIVMLNPGESLSTYIKGKWTVSEINQPITKFGGTVLFYFDNDSKFYDDGYNWLIAVTN